LTSTLSRLALEAVSLRAPSARIQRRIARPVPGMAGPQPPPPPVPNRDLLLRLSYTQQAATYLHLAQHAQDTEASGSGQASADAGISSKGKQPARVEADESASFSSGSKRRRGRKAKQHGAPGSLARLARSLASDIPRVTSHNKIRLCVYILSPCVRCLMRRLITRALRQSAPGTRPSSGRFAGRVTRSSCPVSPLRSSHVVRPSAPPISVSCFAS
jgi:hypothetical protein